VVQLGAGLLLYMLAVPHLSSAEIALITILEIIFGVASTWLFVGERPGDAALIGGAIVIGALVVNHIVGMRQAPPVAI
jgi:drug/metabolite transporter (DMT)-like permease